MGRILLEKKIKLDSVDCHVALGPLRSERLPGTASATCRFGPGVVIACAVALLANRTDVGRMKTEIWQRKHSYDQP